MRFDSQSTVLNLAGNNSHGGREKSGKAGREEATDSSSSSSVLRKVAEFQNVMADLYLQQAEADEMLFFLAVDYKRILQSVDSALAYRRRALKLLQKEIKKNGGSKVRSDKNLSGLKNTLDHTIFKKKLFPKMCQIL